MNKVIEKLNIISLLILLSSCSTTSKISYLSKKKIEKGKIEITREGVKPFEISDCAVGIVIIPINPLIDFDKEVENTCGKKWEIFDLVQKETKFSIPIVYGQYCRTVRGSCKKQ